MLPVGLSQKQPPDTRGYASSINPLCTGVDGEDDCVCSCVGSKHRVNLLLCAHIVACGIDAISIQKRTPAPVNTRAISRHAPLPKSRNMRPLIGIGQPLQRAQTSPSTKARLQMSKTIRVRDQQPWLDKRESQLRCCTSTGTMRAQQSTREQAKHRITQCFCTDENTIQYS